ncbi:hypothetical protein QFC20_006758 [Naganishia adeliensis]|uniref:Uncharacterized protein n=1 Tax=Naganishia adeliensis TaxID=92952 RepID=A0ACC2V834_9TREE|nr:hypothetical protein QFC20_006758 [Naganishia adeliensis]
MESDLPKHLLDGLARAIFDPLSSIDLASLPPLPTTPPGNGEVNVTAFPEITLGNDNGAGENHKDIGWTPMLNPRSASTSSQTTQWTGNGKLVDIITPMPTYRTLQPKPAAESRFILPPRIEEEFPGPSKSPLEESLMLPISSSRKQTSADESVLLPTFSSPRKPPHKPANTTLADTTRFHGFTTINGDVSDLMGDDKSFMDAMMRSPSDSAEAESTRQVGTERRAGPESPVKGKGKPRAVDSVREETPDSEGGGRRHGFGSVLAGMAAYEASIGRQVASQESQGEVSEVQIVVSKASDSPSVVSAVPGSPRRHAPRPNSNSLAVADQTGDVSTLFPSSPSIKRYMNTQTHRASAPSMDDSRLDMVDLSDLRSAQIDRRIADESDTTTLQADLDRSTIYPSSPAVRRNMARSTMDLMRDVQEEEMDSRLEQSVYHGKGKQRETARPDIDSFPTASSSSAVPESPARRHRRSRQDDGAGDQTMDLGAMIKRTSRKLTTDYGDTTFLAPSSSAGGRGALDQSMLIDIQSPFKPARGGKKREVEESYYDLMGGDNTFMKQVEDVTIGDDSPIKGNILPPVLQSRHPIVTSSNDFVFKIPELPSKISPKKASEASSIPTSPTTPRAALPLVTGNTSPIRSAPASGTLSTPTRSVQRSATTRTLFTPSTTRVSASGSTHTRHLSSDYRSTTALPPRTPLAERGFGPQSAKKVSSSSISSVLGETDGRSVNIRAQTSTGSGGMKRSATMNDFTPVKHERSANNDETPRGRFAIGHARSPSDSAAGAKPGSTTIPSGHKRSSTISSPSRYAHAKEPTVPGATSRVRLPGQGLRQVSGQGKVDDPDARTRKQAMSPEKLLQRVSRPTAAPQASASPSRTRTGFRPVPSQQSAPPRAVGSSSSALGSAPGQPRTSTARMLTSRTGSSSSMLTARSSGLPSRTSTTTSISRPAPKSAVPAQSSSAATRMPAPSATMAGRAANGLPRPTSTFRPRSTVPAPVGTARPSSTSSAATKSRLVAPTAMQSRPGAVPVGRSGSSIAGRSTGLPAKKAGIEVARGRLDRVPGFHK